MIRLAEIIARHAADYRARYGHQLTPERGQALRAMQYCRSTMARTCSRPARTALSAG